MFLTPPPFLAFFNCRLERPRYLTHGGNVSDVVSYHLYPGYGLDPHLKVREKST
jgi:hypothetical protein